MRIYTRAGDAGETGLAGGQRRTKADVRIEAYGTVDEAGAFIGLAEAHLDPERDADLLAVLDELQQTLWDVGSDLARPAKGEAPYRTNAHDAGTLEPIIDRYSAQAPPIDRFILRGGSRSAAYLHVACTVLRRAERRAVALSRLEDVNPAALAYLNRASDLLFTLARAINAREGREDVFYRQSGRSRGS